MALSIKVEVKWQKDVFKDVEIDMSQPPSVFKMQLFSLTGVPPERQKIMGFKGGLLKDDADWTAIGAKDKQKITMMGTADAVPQAPTKEQTFVEDIPEDEQDHTGLSRYGAGLENLGNTCYMNSTLQCLYAVPELRSSLSSLPAATTASDPLRSLTVAAGHLFSRLERSAQPVTPLELVATLRQAYPQFDQRSREGFHMQQDAEECWSAILLAMRQHLSNNEIQRLFGIRTHAVLTCDETDETMELNELETALKCNISGTVNHLNEGIKLGLQGDREKTSMQLNRLASFRGEASIVELPQYLTVQMVRFFYKADVQQKAKILRRVTFPLTLDLFEFCSQELQEKLQKGPRLVLKEGEDANSKKQRLEVEETNQLTGRYELIGVLTHKGRSADSGHYVSWVKQSDGQWVQFDDDTMIVRKEEDVLSLSGGGDWHMAYMLLYKAQRVEALATNVAES